MRASLESAAVSSPAGTHLLKESQSDCLVVLPTYNERENLESAVNAVVRLGHDVLVVDDNSPDGTGALADRLAGAFTRVQVLHRNRKLGLGTAYRAGFQLGLEQGYQLIVEMDADGSHDPQDLDRLIAASRGSRGLSIGSRYIFGGGTKGWSLERRFLSGAANVLCRSTLTRVVHDWTSGFRCFWAPVFNDVRLDSLSCTGFSVQIELAFRCFQIGIPIVEVPITFSERKAGTSKASPHEILEALACVARLRTKAGLFRREAVISLGTTLSE